MFTKLYSWCTSLGDKLINGGENSEFVDYYTGYFIDTPVCSNIFLAGIGIALVIALIFYFGICNFVFSLAKRWVWAIVLVIVFVSTMFTTIPMIVGNNAEVAEDATGIFAKAYAIEESKLDLTEDTDQRDEITAVATEFRDQFISKEDDSTVMGEDLPMEMAITNAVYSVILFFIFSLLFKKHTRDGSAIPF
ncbi:MAG: hypothetical protein IJE12_05810 [Prevotella sp.]|nr:hypothetical protein [Prevotella sp.]